MATSQIAFGGRQWLRFAQLVVGKSSNDVALDLSNLRFSFTVRADDVDSPNTLSVRVYNPSEQTVKTIINEFDTVILTAGYVEGQKGDLFSGTVQQYMLGRERNVDSFLDIFAADGDLARNFGVANLSRPAGGTDGEQLSDLAAAMGIPIAADADGFIDTGGIRPNPRGKVAYGMARDYMRNLAQKNDCRWSIQNGFLTLIPNSGYLTKEIIKLSSDSGMLGTPEQTENGIMVRCYLNPQIQVGQLVQIDNAAINQATRSGNIFFPSYTSQYYPATTSADGFYRVLVAEHEGDTRGNTWETQLTCLVAHIDANENPVPTN